MGSICSVASQNFHTNPIKNPLNRHVFHLGDFNSMYAVSERVLSRSGQCQVRLCKKNSTGKLYVVKIVSSSSTFSLEADILKKLDHPNVIKMIGSYIGKLQQHMVIEYLPHGDLLSFLEKITKLPEKTAAEVMHQVLTGLSYCHKAGVVHRDIKPENILLSSIGKKGIRCKITDFDSATVLNKAGKGVFGTLYYTAPEVFDGEYDEKSDVWSAGVMLYQLLTGRHLFHGSTIEEIQNKINSTEIILENSISTEARDLLEKILARDPDSRISAQEACVHPWIMKLASIKSNSDSDFVVTSSSGLLRMYEDYYIENFYSEKKIKSLNDEFLKLDLIFDGKIVISEKNLTLAYSDFLRSSIPRSAFEDKEKLMKFFNEFDLKGTGKVTPKDLKMVNCEEKYSSTLEELLRRIYTHSKQEIDFEAFFNLIVKTF